MNLDSVKKFFRTVPDDWETRHYTEVKSALQSLKKDAVAGGDQHLAKEIWCYERVAEVQERFISAFKQCKSSDFYGAWCTFERVELAAKWLLKHYEPNESDEFSVLYIEAHTKRFQELYPYAAFMSPEFVGQKTSCSTCGKPISLRAHCGHEVGEIYDGEMCARIVDDFQVSGIALVKNPVQKYSVPFSTDPVTNATVDQYNYSLVKYVVRGLESPFHTWTYKKTKKRHPHERYKTVGRNEPCPCDSGLKYKKCCLPTEGVLRPHFQILFSVEPPPELTKLEFH